MQDHKSMLTQTIDKIVTQKIEEADRNIKPRRLERFSKLI